MKENDSVRLYVNQGVRDGVVLAVIGSEALIEYEMPKGSTALVVCHVDNLDCRKSVPYKSLPLRWLERVVEAEMEWVGRPQGNGGRAVENPREMLEQRLGKGRLSKGRGIRNAETR